MQEININSDLGIFYIPWFEEDTDNFKVAPSFDAAGLEIQILINQELYIYTGNDIVEYTGNEVPYDETEIVYEVPDSTNGFFSIIHVHSNLYSNLNVYSGESIGILSAKADNYGSVCLNLGFENSFNPNEDTVTPDNVGEIDYETLMNSLIAVLAGETEIEDIDSDTKRIKFFNRDGIEVLVEVDISKTISGLRTASIINAEVT